MTIVLSRSQVGSYSGPVISFALPTDGTSLFRRLIWVNRTRAQKCVAALTVVLVTGGVGLRASADQLKFRKFPRYKNVVVLTFEAGHLRFRLAWLHPRAGCA